MPEALTKPTMWSALGGECTLEEPFASEHGGMFLGFASETSTGRWPEMVRTSAQTDTEWFHAYTFGMTVQEIPIEPPPSIDKWIMKSVRRIRGGPSIEWSTCWQHLDEEGHLDARARAKDLAKAIGAERRDLVVDLFGQDWAEQKRYAGELPLHPIIDRAIEQGILRAARHQPWEEGCLLVLLETADEIRLSSALEKMEELVVEHV